MYQDYDSDSDVPEELKQDYVDEQTGDAPLKRSVPSPFFDFVTSKMTHELHDDSSKSDIKYNEMMYIWTWYYKCVK